MQLGIIRYKGLERVDVITARMSHGPLIAENPGQLQVLRDIINNLKNENLIDVGYIVSVTEIIK